jgi:hypothetical protein
MLHLTEVHAHMPKSLAMTSVGLDLDTFMKALVRVRSERNPNGKRKRKTEKLRRDYVSSSNEAHVNPFIHGGKVLRTAKRLILAVSLII